MNNNLGSDKIGQGLGSGSAAWKTIGYAINNVANPTSDTIIIHIAAGVYNLSNNQISIQRYFTKLSLLGDSTSNTIVESESDTSLSNSRVIRVYRSNNVTFKYLTIQNGRSATSGGGIYIDSAATVNIDHCNIIGNIGSSTGLGGGIGNYWGNLLIINSTISNNTGQSYCYGGGIGIQNGNTSIINSTISNNISSSGGGIAVIAFKGNTVFNMNNSTVSGNIATFGIGGIRFDKYPVDSTLADSFYVSAHINSCTIFNNLCTGPNGVGGIGVWHSEAGDSLYIKNSIVSGNIATVDSEHSDLSGKTISEDYNLIQNTYLAFITGNVIHNIYGISADCKPLAYNNSLNGTMTCAISSNSPARDVIPVSSPNGSPQYDQRGAPRKGNYDIGAYEYWNDSSTFPITANLNQQPVNPASFTLFQNYPNPFNPTTQITFNIAESGYVKLSVYNVIGQLITELVRGYESAGIHRVTFNAAGLPSGIYLYRLQQNASVMIKKMILLK